ncbi:MAG: hypothetical protein L3J28_03760 [Candidatus Polarisedimenticolaceae bacterium]|nr:hypothetical protein [Candidatus Polarisedimenticolaceae bacterium]
MLNKAVILIMLLAAPLVGHAQVNVSDCIDADNNATVINTVPYRISNPGLYCLDKSIQYNGHSDSYRSAVISIASDNVTLDLNGHVLTGNKSKIFIDPGNQSYSSTGIGIGEHQNITIRNGSLDGFYRGILIGNQGSWASHVLIENMRIIDTTEGIRNFNLKCRGCVIQNNYFADNQYGIRLSHPKDTHIINNTIVGIGAVSTSSVGISISSGDNMLIKGNHMSGVSVDVGVGLGTTGYGSKNLVLNNTATMLNRGFYASMNEYFSGNMTGLVTTPLIGSPILKGTNLF